MSSSSLKDAVSAYEAAIQELKKDCADKQVLAALIARDQVQAVFAESEEELGSKNLDETTLYLIQLDRILRELASKSTWSYKVDAWRNSLDKSPEQWWWCSNNLQLSQRSRKAFILNTLSIGFLIPTAGLLISTSSKLLTLNLGWLSSSTIVLQSFLVYLATQTTLSNSNHWFDRLFNILHRPSREKPEVKFIFTLLVGAFVALVNQATLEVSKALTETGEQKYEESNYISAQSNLENAVKLNSSNTRAINLLGEIYEEVSSLENKYLEQAHENYILAIKQGSTEAAINLSRLLILDGINHENKSNKFQYYFQARKLLESIREEVDNLEEESLENLYLQYNYHANLGWLHFELYKLAQSDQETKSESAQGYMFMAHKEFTLAINIFLMAEESADKNGLAGISEISSLQQLLRAYFGKHVNAYCLRADLVNTIREDGFDSIDFSLESEDWSRCSLFLSDKPDKKTYEIEWHDRSQTSLLNRK